MFAPGTAPRLAGHIAPCLKHGDAGVGLGAVVVRLLMRTLPLLDVSLEAESVLEAGDAEGLLGLDVELDVLAASLGTAFPLADASLDKIREGVVILESSSEPFEVKSGAKESLRHFGKTVPCSSVSVTPDFFQDYDREWVSVASDVFAHAWQFQHIRVAPLLITDHCVIYAYGNPLTWSQFVKINNVARLGFEQVTSASYVQPRYRHERSPARIPPGRALAPIYL